MDFYDIILFLVSTKGYQTLTIILLCVAYVIFTLNRREDAKLLKAELALEKVARATLASSVRNDLVDSKHEYTKDEEDNDIVIISKCDINDKSQSCLQSEQIKVCRSSLFAPLSRRKVVVPTDFGNITVDIVGNPSTASRRFLAYHDIGMNGESCFNSFIQVSHGDARFSSGGICFYLVNAPGHEKGATTQNDNYLYPTIPQLSLQLKQICKTLKTGRVIGLGVGIGSRILLELATRDEYSDECVPSIFSGLIIVGPTQTKAGYMEKISNFIISKLLRIFGHGYLTTTKTNSALELESSVQLTESRKSRSWFDEFISRQHFSPRAMIQTELINDMCEAAKSIPSVNISGFIETSYCRMDLSPQQKSRLKKLRLMCIVGTHTNNLRCRWSLYNSSNEIWKLTDRQRSSVLKVDCVGAHVFSENPIELMHPISLFLEANCDCA